MIADFVAKKSLSSKFILEGRESGAYDIINREPTMQNLKRLTQYLAPYKQRVLCAIACMVVNGVLSGALMWMLKDLLKPIIHQADMMQVTKVTALLLLLSVARGATDFAQNYLAQSVGQGILSTLRQRLFEHLQTLSLGYFENQRTGQIMSRLTNDVSALQGVLTLAVVSALTAPMRFLVSFGVMVFISWKLTLFALVGVPLIAAVIVRAGRRMRRVAQDLQSQLAELASIMQEKLSAIRIVQIFTMERTEAEQFDQINRRIYRSSLRSARVQNLLSPGVEVIGMGGFLIGLWMGAWEVSRGVLEPEKLIVFLFAIIQASGHFKAISNLKMSFHQADTAAGRIFEILDTPPDIRDAPDAVPLPSVQGRIVFDDICFAYNGSGDVLRHVRFEVEPGEVIALAGPSGAGKTTIANLIPRLYDPIEGTIWVDGYDIRKIALRSLREQIGIVPQDTVLFAGSVRDNIAYGKPNATDEEIAAAARRANADEFIRALPDGYHTVVGERGAKLSGGQRQRIAIARALLRDPRILILDEATSNLDAESERLVQDALQTLMENRTTLIIAHRLSTIQKADRILVIESGRIVEQGTHEELMSNGGLYRRLYETQLTMTNDQ
jgi:subfamily B ATP-binding cassette protein MsbA